jgi:hypothetical protein
MIPTSSGVWPASAAFSADSKTPVVDSATSDKANPGDLSIHPSHQSTVISLLLSLTFHFQHLYRHPYRYTHQGYIDSARIGQILPVGSPFVVILGYNTQSHVSSGSVLRLSVGSAWVVVYCCMWTPLRHHQEEEPHVW